MELKNLTTFIHVAELGSFTKAAEQLGYSQSTISFQIKQLEDELGCLLFERINHSVTLTEKGLELISYAHKIRALTDELKTSLVHESELSGHIHIVTPDSVCEDMVTKNYVDFYNKYPSISLKFTTADTVAMFNMLDRNEADLILTLDGHIYQRDYIIVKEEPLTMHFVASSASPFAGKKNLSVKDILKEPFIMTEQGQGYRRVFDNELAKRSLEIIPVMEIGRTDIITEVVAKSNMISYLPDFVTQKAVEEGKLVHLDVHDVNIDIWKQLIYHKNKWMSKSLKAFIEYIETAEFNN